MSKTVRIVLVFVLFVLLFLVRAYEMQMFYDPLINYFQNDYLYKSIPEINSWHLVVDMLYRYSINSVISLGIIHLIFQNKKYLKFSGFLMMFAFMVLIIIFAFLLRSKFDSGYLLPFYIRRFIVHPLFLIILLPAFYYHKKSISSKN